jgi:hypothetical protein
VTSFELWTTFVISRRNKLQRFAFVDLSCFEIIFFFFASKNKQKFKCQKCQLHFSLARFLSLKFCRDLIQSLSMFARFVSEKKKIFEMTQFFTISFAMLKLIAVKNVFDFNLSTSIYFLKLPFNL